MRVGNVQPLCDQHPLLYIFQICPLRISFSMEYKPFILGKNNNLLKETFIFSPNLKWLHFQIILDRLHAFNLKRNISETSDNRGPQLWLPEQKNQSGVRNSNSTHHAIHRRLADNQPHNIQWDAVHRVRCLRHQQRPHKRDVPIVLHRVFVLRDADVLDPQGEDIHSH